MPKRTISYRGSLKSCNYQCSYCPFSKGRCRERELEKDKSQWREFCCSFANRSRNPADTWGRSTGAVLVTPYGEALIHPWYWEGLGFLSRLSNLEAVGGQTNLSFNPGEALSIFDRSGGRREKLRLWATFHPEMVSVSCFSRQCARLKEEGIDICVGAVGVPENISILRQLRNALPQDIYLWINRMDGLKRPYLPLEEASFLEIDPLFSQELSVRKADPGQCLGRLFVEGNKTVRICNISRPLREQWPQCISTPPARECGRTVCSCFLAYGGRRDFENRFFFGRYPLFRIPWRPKAFFFDIDGTLIRRGETHPDPEVLKGLQRLSLVCPLFFATSLPRKKALERCKEFSHLFSGGIFAGGANVVLEEKGTSEEVFFPLENSMILLVKMLPKHGKLPGSESYFHMLIHENKQMVYKITFIKSSPDIWTESEAGSLLAPLSGYPFRYFIEGNCLQITALNADKGHGIQTLCGFLGIRPADAGAAGDSEEDIPMFSVCGYGIASLDSPQCVQEAADMVWEQNKGWA